MSSISGLYVVRAIDPSDLEGFFALAQISGPGFTSLQPNMEYLKRYIDASMESFANPDVKKSQKFLLVMEEVNTGKVVGCAAVKTKIGIERPFVDFVMKDGRGNPTKDVRNALYLDPDHAFDGATEVGSLFMHPDHRKGGLGRYLAKSRYMLIGTAPEVFSSPIIAELRGNQDASGKSPFYSSVHKARLQKTFEEADEFITHADDEGMKAVIPTAPIVIENLPPEAHKAIGQPHESGVGAYHLLMKEGFSQTEIVDLFDAGPIMSASFEDLATIRESRNVRLNIKSIPIDPKLMMVSSTKLSSFRAVIGEFECDETSVSLNVQAATALTENDGANVRYWTRPDEHKHIGLRRDERGSISKTEKVYE